jgi:phosphatidate cytidylyltransferase
MLRQRVITAVILMAGLLAALVWLPPIGFDLLLLLVVLAGAWEWTTLAGTSLAHLRIGFQSVLLLSCGLLMQQSEHWLQGVLLAAVLWWPFALYCIMRQPRSVWLLHQPSGLLLVGWLVLVPSWLAVYWMQRLPGERLFHVLWFVALVAAADTGAYFAGKAFGRHKLAPLVSPNKTWEGFFGGMVATALVAVAGAKLGPTAALHDVNVVLVITAALLMAVFSVVGDLFESLLKRTQNLKDSGNVLPGHGGVMDRLDSITAALPLFVLLLLQVTGLSS